MIVKKKNLLTGYIVCSNPCSYFIIILGRDRKEIDRTELFVIFNNRGITENGFGAIFHLLFPLCSVSTMTVIFLSIVLIWIYLCHCFLVPTVFLEQFLLV